MRELANVCEGVDEFGARALKMCEQARDVAPVDAATRGEQVVAGASGDAAQLQLARRGRVVGARARAGQREARVALDAFARGEQRMPLRFINRPSLRERVFDCEERAHGRASRALNLPLVRRGVFVCRVRAGVARGGAAREQEQRRQRPDERGGGGLRCLAHAPTVACAPPFGRVPSIARAQAEEVPHAEWRSRRKVDDGEFAQKHRGLPEGNGHASFRGARRRARRGAGYSAQVRIFRAF